LARWLALGLVSLAAWAAGLPRLTAAPTLNSLTLSAGTLVPSFAAGALTYSAAVGHEVASVTVTTTTGFQNLVTINGASTSSRSLALNQGANIITIVVSETAALAARPPIARAGARPQAFGDTQTYTVTVTRAAQAFVVTTTADEFDTPSGVNLSLREALRDAAAFAGPGVITFAAGLNGGTLTLGSELVVDDADGVTVDSSGLAGGLTLNGGGAVRHFNVSSAGNLTLRALTLSGGNTTGNGGSIHSTGTLTAERCTFAGNSAHTGGAIFADNGSSTVLR
jgi:predicted outer membrane repeat protein